MKERVLHLFRVPPRPEPPPGAPGSLKIFRAARPFFRYQLLLWVVGQIGGLTGLLFGVSILRNIPPDTPGRSIFYGLEILAWVAYVANLPLTLYLVRLDYEMRWYMVTDRSLRIREGIVRIKEKTMTFANIQNLGVKQGPLQRFLGIQDLEVTTAGGGGSQHQQSGQVGESMHVAKFRGVDNAEEIRLLIREGMRRHRDSGLGDPDERKPQRPAPTDAVAAAREVLSEVRALRAAIGN
ncbi:MAG: PH domain-containing protein [Acidobacteria bacterium]|nr:PH domain-containing protein [Acidobacteriota bacterium]